MKKTKRISAVKKAKKIGPVVVYTYGVFDLFHVGHLQLLKEAKKLGDKLIVGIYTDEVATKFKRKPIIPQAHRAAVVGNIGFVDEVIFQDEFQPNKNLLKIKPHKLVKGPGAGWEKGKNPPGAEVVKAWGGIAKVLDYHDVTSTSKIIEHIWKLQQQ